jgi:hypothetical protein
VSGCTALTQLPARLSVGGGLFAADCTALTQLPADIDVANSLCFTGCTALVHLPDNLQVKGELYLTGCTGLTRLPDNLSVAGLLYLTSCTGLTQLPDTLSAARNVYLTDCTALQHLPARLRVYGALHLAGCTSLTRLPADLRVDRNLLLLGCTALRQLPENLTVGGDLIITGCTSLAQLPGGLSVCGSLFAQGCVALTQIAADLRVDGSMTFGGCTSLSQLPLGLRIGASLYLTGCTSLTSLPEDVAQWAPPPNHASRTIDLTNSGLSDAIMLRLRQSIPAGVQVYFGVAHTKATDADFTSLTDALIFWAAIEPALGRFDPAPWQLTADEDLMLRQFLGRLRGTADYCNLSVRPHLAARLVAVIEAIDRCASLRAQCLYCITGALESCDDRVMLVMNQLELAVRVHHAEHNNIGDGPLQMLMLGLMKLDIVHAHARAKVASLRFVDEVEVFLAYEVGLRDALQLPVSAHGMLFATCAGVTQDDLDKACAAARDAAADRAQLAAYLASSAPWQRHLRQRAAAHWTWKKLVPKRQLAPIALQTLRCPLTLEPYAALAEPIVWQQGQVCVVYEAADFIKHWVAHGYEPTTRRRIALHEMSRLL